MQDIRDVQTWNLNRKEREDRKDRTKDFLTFGKKKKFSLCSLRLRGSTKGSMGGGLITDH
jgi:hypothetical protein